MYKATIGACLCQVDFAYSCLVPSEVDRGPLFIPLSRSDWANSASSVSYTLFSTLYLLGKKGVHLFLMSFLRIY